MNTKTRAEFVNERPGCLLGSFCPECGGDVASDPVMDRIIDHRLVSVRPVVCLYCGLRMGYADPCEFPTPLAPGIQPAERIKALDWSRAVWQVDEGKRVSLLADVVDQVLERVEVDRDV